MQVRFRGKILKEYNIKQENSLWCPEGVYVNITEETLPCMIKVIATRWKCFKISDFSCKRLDLTHQPNT